MALLLLDTTALIDFSKGFEPTTSWIKNASDAGDDLAVCPITIAEFCSGLTSAEFSDWDQFLSSLTFCPLSFEASIQAGRWRSSFSAQGIQLSTTDTLVAAAASEAGATIVTSNLKHYPMGLRLIDPRDGGAS